MPRRGVPARFLLTLDGTAQRDSYETVFIGGATVPYHTAENSTMSQFDFVKVFGTLRMLFESVARHSTTDKTTL